MTQQIISGSITIRDGLGRIEFDSSLGVYITSANATLFGGGNIWIRDTANDGVDFCTDGSGEQTAMVLCVFDIPETGYESLGADKKKGSERLVRKTKDLNSKHPNGEPKYDDLGRALRTDGTHHYNDAFQKVDDLLSSKGRESFSRMVLRTRMLGDSESKNFTLDENGEYVNQGQYATVGSHVQCSGQVTSPSRMADGTAALWTIKVESTCDGYKKEYDDVPSNTVVDFSVPTSFGETTLTIKLWSSRGVEDAGVTGTLEMSD